MVGAFSHSTAVGKLRLDLPDVPVGARVNMPRYGPDEAAAVCHYYVRFAYVNFSLVDYMRAFRVTWFVVNLLHALQAKACKKGSILRGKLEKSVLLIQRKRGRNEMVTSFDAVK